jgi:hypothetical protein
MARRQSVLSLSAYATKIGRSLVPADLLPLPTPDLLSLNGNIAMRDSQAKMGSKALA